VYALSGELGVSQAFLAHWYIGGGYMDVSEVVVFMIVAKYTRMQDSCVLTYPIPSLIDSRFTDV